MSSALEPVAIFGKNLESLKLGIFGFADYSILICLITFGLFFGILKIGKLYQTKIYVINIITILGFLIIKAVEKHYYESSDDNFLLILVKFLALLLIGYLFLMQQENKTETLRFEYPTLIILAFFGILLSLENTEGLIIFLGLEIQAFTFYTMVSLTEKDISSAEGALKYFLIGAMASGLFIFGIGLVYGELGKTNFLDVLEIIHNKETMIILGGLLILMGLLFKIGAAPFHLWLPDAYEGAPFYVLLFLLSMPKIVLFYLIFTLNNVFEQNLLIFIAMLLSAVIGSVQAFSQTKVKRFIAYTIIYNNTFFLGLMFLSGKGAFYALIESLVLYLIVTLTTALALFMLRNKVTNLHLFSIRDLISVKKSNTFLSFVIVLGFFSAAGIPPFIGFFQKYIILWILAEKLQLFILVLLIVSSILPAFYYIRMPKIVYFLQKSEFLLFKDVARGSATILALFTVTSLSVFY